MEKYKIKNLESRDYDQIAAVWEAYVRATHQFLQTEDIVQYRVLLRNEYLQMVTLHGVKVHGSIAGFIGVCGTSIEMLFVDPAHLRKGIGRSLAKYAIGKLGCRYVDVNEQNSQALLFYIKLGFAILRRSALDGLGKPYPILHLHIIK